LLISQNTVAGCTWQALFKRLIKSTATTKECMYSAGTGTLR